MDDFYNAGQIERRLLKKLAAALDIEQMIETPSLGPYDCYTSKNGKTAIWESKVRRSKHDYYDSTLVERAKYDDLWHRKGRCEAHMVLYVEFYTDGWCRIYNLAKIDMPEWKKQWLNNTTMGDYSRITKEVGFIPYEQGTLKYIGIDYDDI